ncbi:uncharacterized protein [Nicotiana sylvestris]|uniref:uncharacterized protein n=1 Tax=Nicotiana sylvestris TaxID=4096 RepID=UPI00388C6476
MGINMSNSQVVPSHTDADLGLDGENENIVASENAVPPTNPDGPLAVDLVDVGSRIAIYENLGTDLGNSARRDAQAAEQNTQNGEEGGISLRMIFEMLQTQQAAIVQLQNQNRAPSRIKLDASQEVIHKVDQILGAPPILKGLDSKKFVQKPFPPSAALKRILKKFHMPEIPKYNGTTNPNKYVTSYTCGIKGNDLEDDEIESVLLKKFRETLSKGPMIWYHNLPPNSTDSFAMIADLFVKAYTGAIKVATRKLYLFKVRQKNNEMLRKFISRFQRERMDLPPVTDDWAAQAFTQCLNKRRSVVSRQLKQNLIQYSAVTWVDVHNR